jgi:hypothetical protein
MTKIFIATPAYSGTVHVPYAISLSETVCYLAQAGINTLIRINTAGSLLVAERNRLIKAFLETDCTHMLFIDGDLGWPAQAVKALIEHDEDFVAGVYPSRKENIFMFRPILNEDQSIAKSEKNLLGMEYIPAGFMLLKRHVLEKVIEMNPDLYFKPKDPNAPDGHALFNTEVFEGEFWGEDYVFCRRARECGFKIYVDPLIEFDHAGIRGILLNALTDKKPEYKNEIRIEV